MKKLMLLVMVLSVSSNAFCGLFEGVGNIVSGAGEAAGDIVSGAGRVAGDVVVGATEVAGDVVALPERIVEDDEIVLDEDETPNLVVEEEEK